jgi:GH35 family endo-1,4-beta-xylanase
MMPHEESPKTAQRALEVSCIQGMDFVSNVIIWHYTTNLCFFTKEASDSSEVASTCMELSNYIMHLVAKHKAMVGSDGLYMLSMAQLEVKNYLKRSGAPIDSTGFSHKVCNGVPREDLFAGLRQARSVYMELLQINGS